jgi:hypothetical protein
MNRAILFPVLSPLPECLRSGGAERRAVAPFSLGKRGATDNFRRASIFALFHHRDLKDWNITYIYIYIYVAINIE